MASICETYTKAVWNNMKPLFANWEPGKPVQLGDYGVLSGRTFIHIGNVKDYGINFASREDPELDHKYFSSEGAVDVKILAKGAPNISGVVNANATIEISFGRKDAVFFNAAECRFSMIQDKSCIGKEIMKLHKSDKWEKDWAVITDLVQAGSTTIAISATDQASVILEAKGDIQKINLADASISLNVIMQKNVGYVVETMGGLIPLIGLSKIQGFWEKSEEFEPISSKKLWAMGVASSRSTEELQEDLYFGPLKS